MGAQSNPFNPLIQTYMHYFCTTLRYLALRCIALQYYIALHYVILKYINYEHSKVVSVTNQTKNKEIMQWDSNRGGGVHFQVMDNCKGGGCKIGSTW